jgi:hypothetical protein
LQEAPKETAVSAHNRLFLDHIDPETREKKRIALQFKRGRCYQIDYLLGERLKWGGNDKGEPGKKKVVVEGVEEGSIQEGKIRYWYIFFENDVIISAEPDDGRYEFTNPDDYGIVLEE